MERNFYRWFFSVTKKEYPPRIFSKSCNFLQMIFGWEQREANNIIARNSSASDILTYIADCWCKISCTNEGSVINQSCSTQFPVATFPRWLCLVHGQLAISPRRVKRSFIRKCQFSLSSIFNNGQFYLKYYFLRHRVSPQSVNCCVSVLNFHSPKY